MEGMESNETQTGALERRVEGIYELCEQVERAYTRLTLGPTSEGMTTAGVRL